MIGFAFTNGGNYNDNVAATAAAAKKRREEIAQANDPIFQLAQQKKREQEAAAKLASEQQALRLSRAARKPGMGASGRAGTILTSPLGDLGLPTLGAGRKTILGG